MDVLRPSKVEKLSDALIHAHQGFYEVDMWEALWDIPDFVQDALLHLDRIGDDIFEIIIFNFDIAGEVLDDLLDETSFTPLFRELETRDNLELVTVKNYVTTIMDRGNRYDEPASATLLPLLSRILEAFQRNDKLRRLQFIEVKVPRHFTPTFLGALEAANLTSLHL